MVYVETIKCFKSYLCDRSQYVVYNDQKSMTHPIKCGVPQGYWFPYCLLYTLMI